MNPDYVRVVLMFIAIASTFGAIVALIKYHSAGFGISALTLVTSILGSGVVEFFTVEGSRHTLAVRVDDSSAVLQESNDGRIWCSGVGTCLQIPMYQHLAWEVICHEWTVTLEAEVYLLEVRRYLALAPLGTAESDLADAAADEAKLRFFQTLTDQSSEICKNPLATRWKGVGSEALWKHIEQRIAAMGLAVLAWDCHMVRNWRKDDT